MIRKTLVLDINLIVLLVVGTAGVKYLKTHKAITKLFIKGDFEVLQDAIQRSSGIRVTPHTLAEASNFLRQIADPYKSEIGMVFQLLIKNLAEIYVTSVTASNRTEFFRHGLADMTALELVQGNDVLFSTDGRLCAEARSSGKIAVTFSQYRQEYAEEQEEA